MDKPTIIRYLAQADSEEQQYLEDVLLAALLAIAQRVETEHPGGSSERAERQWFFLTGIDG